MFDFFKGFGVTFSTMFKKVVTEEYPEDFPPAAPRYHGRHQLNRHPDGLEKCVGCELCAWACPADAIYVEGGDNTEEARFSPGERYGAIYQINYLRCIGCGLCVEACPTRSLTMTNFYELADDNRQDLIFTKEQLLAPLLPGMEQPPHPMRLGENEQDYYVQGPTLARRSMNGPDVPTRWGSRSDDVVLLLAQEADLPGGAEHRRSARRIAFWILGPVALAGALGMVFARNAVHSALCLAGTMLSLGLLYMAQGALFLGFVQIIVYTGAVMMLFLFVLMLVGRDSSDSVVEVLRGQRAAALLFGVGLAVLLVGGGRAGVHRRHPGRAGRGRRELERQRPRHRAADLHQVPVRLRAHLGAADHRGAGGDGAGVRADPGARQARPAGDGRGAAARRARPDLPAARPRRVRHGELGGRARAAARRLDRARVARRDHRPDRGHSRRPSPRRTTRTR